MNSDGGLSNNIDITFSMENNKNIEIIKKSRISSIDVLRGLVMLFMLIDHVRERIYLHMQVSDPMIIESTT